MSGLVLKLSPKERVLINGAVIENGDRRSVLSGDTPPEKAHPNLIRQIEDLSQVFTDADSRQVLAEASAAVIAGQHYRGLKALRALLPREDRLLSMRPN